MPNSSVDSLRTLGIVAHVDAGKTTLTERILFETGTRNVQGSVDDGTAATDWLPEEQQRGISIQSAAVRVRWEGFVLQVIDTPGHVDFGAEVARSFRVLDSVVVVLDGLRGVESQTISVWRQAERWRCARIVFVNKLDRAAADFAGSIASLRERVGARPVVVSAPLRTSSGELVGIGDVVRGTVSATVDDFCAADLARFREELQLARELLVEECAELDDELLESVLAERPIGEELLLAALRRLTIRGAVVPVAAGSALTGAGVDILLDAVGALLPSLIDRNRDGLVDWFPVPRTDASMRALVFKVEHEEHETVALARVLEGRMTRGMPVYASGNADPFRLESLHLPQAGNRIECDVAGAGAIVTFVVPTTTRTGDTLSEREGAADLPRCEFPSPVVSVLFEPEDSAGLELVQLALARIHSDDPTIAIAVDRETGLPLVSGLGELHLEIVASRVRAISGQVVHASRPRVASRWRVLRGAPAHASVRGGVSGESLVSVDLELVGVDDDALASDSCGPELAGGRMETAQMTVRQVLAERRESGSELVGAKVRVDRLEIAGSGPHGPLLAAAISDALSAAVRTSALVRLEPKVRFTVYAPQESGSVVLADLHVRKADIHAVSSGQLGARIEGEGMLSAFLGYAGRLRSLTKGLGEAHLEHSGWGAADARGESMLPQI